eukprot:gene15139-biopygen7503
MERGPEQGGSTLVRCGAGPTGNCTTNAVVRTGGAAPRLWLCGTKVPCGRLDRGCSPTTAVVRNAGSMVRSPNGAQPSRPRPRRPPYNCAPLGTRAARKGSEPGGGEGVHWSVNTMDAVRHLTQTPPSTHV